MQGEDIAPATGQAGQIPRLADGRDMAPVRSRTYEITFFGEAGPVLGGEFDDCEIRRHAGLTTLHADLPDQCALSGLVQRVIDLHLEIAEVRLVSPASAP